MVRRINIDGDDQADRAAHGGEHRAVFVYQIESYRYWERELRRDDFSHGQFGENFTVQGLADDEVCIGDRYGIGEAIFEVTQPRVTCFRVGIRMREPAMPSLLVAHHRPGFYLRVIKEGLVEAGDEIVLVERGPEQVTVADIDGLLYLPNRSQRLLQRALRIPALSEGWKGSFESLLEEAERPASGTAWEGFQPLTVTAVTRESSIITSFTLTPASGQIAGTAAPGQYLTFRLRPQGPDQPPVIRSYSLSSITDEGYRISVKREPDGAGSRFMHEHVHEGDLIDAAAPRGSFVLRATERPVVLISAGVGATPVIAMLRALAASRAPARSGGSTGRTRARSMRSAGRWTSCSAPPPRSPHRCLQPPRTGGTAGRRVRHGGQDRRSHARHRGVPVDADCYICGPDAFMRGSRQR